MLHPFGRLLQILQKMTISAWIFSNLIIFLTSMSEKKQKETAPVSLLQAAQANDMKTIESFFLDASDRELRAQVNCSDADGVMPIMYASFYGNLMFVQQLIQAGAEVNCREKREWTPLMYAVRYGRLDVTQELVLHSASLEMANDEGHTALMLAAKYGQIDILNFLIKEGADITKTDSSGKSVLQLAEEKGYKIIVETLKNKLEEEK
jgi:ankyrin repeat protein